jgi:translation elongation factor EF-G
VERGSTVSDFDPLEIKAPAFAARVGDAPEHGGCRIHLIDTPGAPDFIGQSLPALEAVETAAIVINAAAGIEPMARRMMDYAGRAAAGPPDHRQQDRRRRRRPARAAGATSRPPSARNACR